MDRRSFLGRVKGLGAAHGVAAHWFVHRVSALAFIPLMLWFVFSLLAVAPLGYEAMVTWVQVPFNGALLFLFTGIAFYHFHHVVAVVLEDYVSKTGNRIACLIVAKFLFVIFGALSLLSVLRLILGAS